MRDDRKFWTPEEFDELKRLRASGMMWEEVDAALGRTKGNSRSKFENERSKDRVRSRVAETASRGAAPSYHQSLTAELMGDPLPGRSALDRRHAECGIRPISLAGDAR